MKSLKATSLKSMAVVGAAAVALTGCTSDSKKSASDSASKATSAASSAAGSATGASSAAASSGASSASSSESPSSSASSSASSAAASAPAGMQAVTAPVAKISFAVPKGWVVVTDANAKDPAILKRLEPLAKRQSVSPEKLTQVYTSIGDVVALDVDSSHAAGANNLNVLKLTTPMLLSKEQFTKDLQSGGNTTKFKPTPGEYKKIDTPAGQGAQMAYSLKAGGKTLNGVSMEIPNGTGNYARVTVTAGSASEAEKIASDVASSAHKL